MVAHARAKLKLRANGHGQPPAEPILPAMISPRESVYLGHLGPIPLYVHWSVLFLVMMLYNSSSRGHGFDLQFFLLSLTVLLMGIILHELGHGLTARALGAFGVTITLWAFGGLCASTRDTLPRRELLIIAAGPLVSFILSGIGYGAFYYLRDSNPDLIFDGSNHLNMLGLFIYLTGYINLWMGAFNSLPIYPLDGGQVVYNLILGTTGKQLLARQVCLTLAVVGALGYLLWMVHQNDDRFDESQLRTVLLMGWLVYNAFQYLR
jgi:Zn-dependent protease